MPEGKDDWKMRNCLLQCEGNDTRGLNMIYETEKPRKEVVGVMECRRLG